MTRIVATLALRAVAALLILTAQGWGLDWSRESLTQRPRSAEAILRSVEEDDLDEVVDDIVSVSGRITQSVHLQPTTGEATAAALVIGSRMVVQYNPVFFADLRRQAGTNWAVVFILAHEMAHHLVTHTETRGPVNPQGNMELEADEVAGYILKTLGASLDAAKASVTAACRILAQPCSPGTAERILAIERGWKRSTRRAAQRRPAADGAAGTVGASG